MIMRHLVCNRRSKDCPKVSTHCPVIYTSLGEHCLVLSKTSLFGKFGVLRCQSWWPGRSSSCRFSSTLMPHLPLTYAIIARGQRIGNRSVAHLVCSAPKSPPSRKVNFASSTILRLYPSSLATAAISTSSGCSGHTPSCLQLDHISHRDSTFASGILRLLPVHFVEVPQLLIRLYSLDLSLELQLLAHPFNHRSGNHLATAALSDFINLLLRA